MFLKSFKSGSRNLLTPPVMNTDDDEIWLVTDIDDMVTELETEGYTRSKYYGSGFRSMSKDIHNILLTDNLELFNSSMFASYMTKKYNIQSKEDRVYLFKALQGVINWEADFSFDEIKVTEK